MMEYLLWFIVFLVGASLGSFVCVIADRFNTGLAWWKGRSFCFSCNTELKNKDLFPVFSFLFLKGKCRYCSSKIPKNTLIIEILMGALSLIAAFKSGFLVSDFSWLLATRYLLLTAIFTSILLISVYDLRHFIIPDAFLVFFFLSSLFYVLLLTDNYWLLAAKLLSGLSLILPFLALFLLSRGRWLGFGDVKYIAIIGFFLGLAQGVSAMILAFWIGAVFSLLALYLKRLKSHININLPILNNNLTIKSEVPFGPFLSLGTVLSFCFNADLFQINSLFGL